MQTCDQLLQHPWIQVRSCGLSQIPWCYHPQEPQMEWTHQQHLKKANSTRAFIQRNLQHCPLNTKAACYTTLVRPLAEYACTVWDPHTALNIQKLEAVHRRSARFVMNNYSQTSSVTSMLEILQWTSLEERRARNKAIMMYRIVHGLVAIPTTELHSMMTTARGHTNRFLNPYARTLLYKHSFFPDSIWIWNNLP